VKGNNVHVVACKNHKKRGERRKIWNRKERYIPKNKKTREFKKKSKKKMNDTEVSIPVLD